MRFCLTNPQATGSEAIVLVVGTPAITLSHDAKENPAKSKEVSKSGVGRGSGSANIGEVWTLRPSAFFFQLHTTLPKADYKDPSHPHHTECYMRFFNESIYYSCNYALLFVPAQTFFILPCTCTTRNVPPAKEDDESSELSPSQSSLSHHRLHNNEMVHKMDEVFMRI